MKDTLNPNEWIVMEALWAKSPATLGETIDRIGSRASWNYKTYQSYMTSWKRKATSHQKSAAGTSSTPPPYPVRNA